LYKKDRSNLPLADKDIFKLPLTYQIKQGNQHLLLWVKRAHLNFDSIKENNVSSVVQSNITNWLSTWKYKSVEVQDPVSDIISWNSNEVERDKESTHYTHMGDMTSEGMTQLMEGTDATSSTE
jgi:hypothetical protein